MSRQSLFRWILLALAVGLPAGEEGVAAQPRKKTNKPTRDVSVFRKQHLQRREKYAAALEALARDCEAKELSDAAARIRRLAEPLDTSELRLTPLPRAIQPPPAADLPPEERQWQLQWQHLRTDYAKDIYGLSRRALNAEHVSYAYDLLREVAYNDPDNIKARGILGFVRNGDEWMSGFEKSMVKEKKVWHDRFGWIPREHVDRYERGERYYKDRWMSAEKESVLRQDFLHCWEIRTEHYRVKTNHSLERGVAIAKKLEDYHALFYQLMAGFFISPDQLRNLVDGSNARPAAISKPSEIHYFRTRDEYLEVVRKETDQPVEITRGIYFPRKGIAYFFDDPNANDDSTLYHEATHQLLSGSRPKTIEVGVKSNFWIIEGIACYMESFHRDGDRFSVGDPNHDRIRAARAHLVNESYYVPFSEFTRMGMFAFQNVKPPQIGKNYSQGAALTHFFMHYDDGRYREALIEHLSQIYSPTRLKREAPESLEELTGVDADEIDRQYAEYIRGLGPRASRESAEVGE
jgi:hypothetical protein